ncbi:hypothetical protein SARC_10592, partial [Sphaeroforma arctica JP610]
MFRLRHINRRSTGFTRAPGTKLDTNAIVDSYKYANYMSVSQPTAQLGKCTNSQLWNRAIKNAHVYGSRINLSVGSKSVHTCVQFRTYYGKASTTYSKEHNQQTKTVYDMRSDTVTKPCKGMRQAIASAMVGDDVFEDDYSIRSLEERVAKLCGMEKALFCPSGTMTNQLALRVHVGALESVVMDHRAHIFHYEGGGLSYHSQAQALPTQPKAGERHLTADVVEAAIFAEDIHCPTTTLVSLENTLHGSVMPLQYMVDIKKMADEKGVKVHLDGARLWNASVASGVSIEEYCKNVESVSLCLSKTLGAPIGSLLVGDHAFITKARKFRKMFGGGWRQAGLLAAGAMYAIDHNWGSTMQAVFDRTKALGEGLRDHGILVNEQFGGEIETNMLWLEFAPFLEKHDCDLYTVGQALESRGVLIFAGRRG